MTRRNNPGALIRPWRSLTRASPCVQTFRAICIRSPPGAATTSTEQPPFNEGSYAAGIATVGEFREVATFLVAEGTGNRISVHVFMDRDGGGEGDAFLADAISIAEGPGGGTSGGGC